MNSIHGAREALIATLLADLDGLLHRVETLPPAIEQAGNKLASDVRQAITAQEAAAAQARQDIGEFIGRQVSQTTTNARSELQRQADDTRARHEQALREAVQRYLDHARAELASRPAAPWLSGSRVVAWLSAVLAIAMVGAAVGAAATAWLMR